MKTRLEQVLERCLNGREIAVWGNPTRSILRVLQPYKYQVADIIDPAKHYVVAVTHEDFDDFIKDEQSMDISLLMTVHMQKKMVNYHLNGSVTALK